MNFRFENNDSYCLDNDSFVTTLIMICHTRTIDNKANLLEMTIMTVFSHINKYFYNSFLFLKRLFFLQSYLEFQITVICVIPSDNLLSNNCFIYDTFQKVLSQNCHKCKKTVIKKDSDFLIIDK